MKVFSIVALTIFLILNVIIGFAYNEYQIFNIITTSVVLLINMIIMPIAFSAKLKDAFFYSLAIILPMLCLIEFFIALKMEPEFIGQMVALALVLTFEILFVYMIFIVSKKNY